MSLRFDCIYFYNSFTQIFQMPEARYAVYSVCLETVYVVSIYVYFMAFITPLTTTKSLYVTSTVNITLSTGVILPFTRRIFHWTSIEI